jgi:hypothetical protein
MRLKFIYKFQMDCLRGTQVVKRKPKENQRRTYIGAWVIFNALSDTDGIFFYISDFFSL